MYTKNKELLLELLEDEGAILFEQQTGTTFLLNNVGYYIWDNIERKTVEEIADQLYNNMSNKYEYTFDEVRAFIKEYVTSLTESGLVACVV